MNNISEAKKKQSSITDKSNQAALYTNFANQELKPAKNEGHDVQHIAEALISNGFEKMNETTSNNKNNDSNKNNNNNINLNVPNNNPPLNQNI